MHLRRVIARIFDRMARIIDRLAETIRSVVPKIWPPHGYGALENSERTHALNPNELNILLSENKPQYGEAEVHGGSSCCVVSARFTESYGYQHLIFPVRDSHIPHYFFSNQASILRRASEVGWQPIALNFNNMDTKYSFLLQGKIVKILPHRLQPINKHEFVLWVDDKLPPLVDGIYDEIESLTQADAVAGFCHHPFLRDNLLLELHLSLQQERFRTRIDEFADYIASKTDSGYLVSGHRLLAGGVFLANMRHSRFPAFAERWFSDVLETGLKDQIPLYFLTQEFPCYEIPRGFMGRSSVY